MPAAGRMGIDGSTGHGAFAPRAGSINGSADVIINGHGALRVSDAWPLHSDGDSVHGGTQATGSSTVYVNGLPLARIGDAISDGDAVASGSSDVICG